MEEAISRNVADLIEDGATLQLGLGPVYDAVLSALESKRDLGVHSDVLTDSVVGLIQSGAVNGSKKTLHQGKAIGSFLVGTNKLYDFASRNPMIELYPIDYTNNPHTISLNESMVSICCALQVDVMGQVSSDTIGQMQLNGLGNQVDFIRGASLSKGGKSIIALRSTAVGGRLLRIVHNLDFGASVSTLRNEVHFVVTEYGIADLRGKTLRQRAESLISIAHPDFRNYLRRAV